MKRSMLCPVCGRRKFRRLYIRKQVLIPYDDTDLTKTEKAIIQKVRKKLGTVKGYKKQRFAEIGYWCSYCGYIEIHEKPEMPRLAEKLLRL